MKNMKLKLSELAGFKNLLIKLIDIMDLISEVKIKALTDLFQ